MLYALHDSNPELKKRGSFVIKLDEAKRYNEQGYGIFFTPNVFNGSRKAENLKELRFYVADIDDGTKEEQMDRIKKLPIPPSKIVESNKGYHCYWRIKDYNYNKPLEIILDNYRRIEKGLVERLKADPHATDVSRLLRYPNYYHCKNPEKPFLVKVVEENSLEVTEDAMMFAYKLPEPIFKKLSYKGDKEDMLKEENWDKVYKYSQAMAEGRNNFLTRVTFWLRDAGFDRGTIEDMIWNMNAKFPTPLEKWEVQAIIRTKL